jgi:signal peptidase II
VTVCYDQRADESLCNASRVLMTRQASLLWAVAIAVAVFVVDQGIKSLVENSMRVGESISLVPGFLDLTYIKNDGGAFGILGGSRLLLLAGSAVAVVVVLWMLFSGRPTRLATIGCGLILGGAAGNLLDRLGSGEVTDYVHFSFWYIFNAADAAIVVGVGLLLLSALRSPEKG